MDVCERVAAIFKILPVLVSFHSGACCAGKKHPTKQEKYANKTSTVRLFPGRGLGLASGWVFSARPCRPCTQPPGRPSIRQASSAPPGFQPSALCGGLGFFLLLSLIFLSFTWTVDLEKGALGTLPLAWHFT